MPLVLLILLVGTLVCLWLLRRNSTVTRACRWRLDRTIGPDTYRCAACGATATHAKGPPRFCLRPAADPG